MPPALHTSTFHPFPLYFPHMTDQKAAKNDRKIVVSGIQPTGKLHIGNYIGAVRNWLRLQDDPQYRCFFFIADWHSMTVEYDPATKRRQVLDLATDLLALGLNPKKVTLFAQSDVTEHAELSWILGTLTPMGFLERMTQYKDKKQHAIKAATERLAAELEAKKKAEAEKIHLGDEPAEDDGQEARGGKTPSANLGLFSYPVLQAADILIYKGQLVPVGTDQVQHVELTRDIAGFFNNRFGRLFPETKPLLTDVPKVRSLAEPTKKMSKSHGDRSCVYLNDSFDEIFAKMKRVTTEATGILSLDERATEEAIAALGDREPDEALKGMAGVWNLLQIIRQFGSEDEMDRLVAAQPLKYGELKRLAATRIAEHFAVFREARAELAKDPAKVEKILTQGAETAREAAQATMKEVRKLTGLR